MTEKMKEVLLYCLAEEYAFYPEDYSKRTIRALEKKGLLDVDDDWYEITEKGIRSLGLPATVRVKKAKTIIKKIVSILSEYDVELLSTKDIPAMAAEEDHNTDRVLWYDCTEALFAIPFYGDEMEYVIAQIACDYAKKQGHLLDFERIRHLLVFYPQEEF